MHLSFFIQLCVILEPMQELMSRHKAYALSPRDCLKTTLFQKWQRMVAPPGKRGRSVLAGSSWDAWGLHADRGAVIVAGNKICSICIAPFMWQFTKTCFIVSFLQCFCRCFCITHYQVTEIYRFHNYRLHNFFNMLKKVLCPSSIFHDTLISLPQWLSVVSFVWVILALCSQADSF